VTKRLSIAVAISFVFAMSCANRATAPPARPGAASRPADLAARLQRAARETTDPERAALLWWRIAELESSTARMTHDAAALDEAVRSYRDVAARYPAFSRMDEVLFELATLEHDRGRREVAARVWLAIACVEVVSDPAADEPAALDGSFDVARCTARRARPAIVAHAWVVLGEDWFDEGKLAIAIAAYRRAVAIGAGRLPHLEPYVRFKLGWSLYRAERYVEAMDALAALLATIGDRGGDLSRQAIERFAFCATEDDWDGDGAIDAQRGFDRPEVGHWLDTAVWWMPEAVLRMAEVYVAASDVERAARAYEELIARWPASPRAAASREALGRLGALRSPRRARR